jgi:hypothetical protein
LPVAIKHQKNGESRWGTLWYFIHDYNAQQSKGLSRHHYYRITTKIWFKSVHDETT